MTDIENRLSRIEKIIDALVKSDRYDIAKTIQMQDGRNIQIAKGTGTRIGTSADQKLGFFGAPPVVQQTGGTGATAFSAGIGSIITDLATFPNGPSGTKYRIGDIVIALQNIGILAS
jgi:hypothetical protein